MDFLAGVIAEGAGPEGRPRIIETPKADYAYRFRVDKNVLARAVSSLVARIDYDNFKNTQGDYHRHGVYFNVWSDLRDLRDADRG